MLQVQNLTKRYGNVLAVNDLSFSIEGNGVYGFLGPNGAGKSTTMNIVTGCLSASAGKITVGGFDILDNPMEAKAAIGYLPENPPLYLDMTPVEYLDFVAMAKGVAKKDRKEAIAKVIEATGLSEMQGRLIKKLSKGYKQRVGIAQAIIGSPKIIILDEPTEGLDPLQRIEIRNLILDLGKEHVVILSSHILSEIAAVADKILIIARGELKAFDTPEKLESDYGSNGLEELVINLTKDSEELAAEAAWEEAKAAKAAEAEAGESCECCECEECAEESCECSECAEECCECAENAECEEKEACDESDL